MRSAGESEPSTSMAAENLLINDGSDGEAVKAVSEGFPQLYVEPALTCKTHVIPYTSIMEA